MSKKIAIVGSSGGNLYSQGGNDPKKLLGEIKTQTEAANLELGFVQFIAASTSFDNISPKAKVELYTLDDYGEISILTSDSLENINDKVKELDRGLAELIKSGDINGLVSVSSDPNSNNKASMEAAKEKQIPVAGSGGSSMGVYESSGCNVVSSTGTTGTNSRTRAIAYISAIAKSLGEKYRPQIGTASSGEAGGSVWKRINIRGIMFSAMPAFIAMALMIALGQISGVNEWLVSVTGNEAASFSAISTTIIGLLPIILAGIGAKQISGFDEVGMVAGIIAGSLSTGGGVLGGLATGIIAGLIVYYVEIICLRNKVPTTTSNLLAGALGGLLAGFIGMFLISPVAAFLGNGIRNVIDQILAYNSTLAGLFVGAVIWFAIIGGVYHAAILPIVLLEMESTGFSFLGAVDLVGLVCVSAGITLANIVFPREKGGRAAAIPGFTVNMCFGTFVEAAYPYMFGNKLVFIGAIISAALGGAMVGMFDIKSTAYVPTFVAPGLTNNTAVQLIITMLVTIAVAFMFTSWANLRAKRLVKSESK